MVREDIEHASQAEGMEGDPPTSTGSVPQHDAVLSRGSVAEETTVVCFCPNIEAIARLMRVNPAIFSVLFGAGTSPLQNLGSGLFFQYGTQASPVAAQTLSLPEPDVIPLSEPSRKRAWLPRMCSVM